MFTCRQLIVITAAAAAAKPLQSCPTLCDPIDGSPPGSPVPGTLQARTLEWVAISFSSAWKWKVKVKSFSFVQLLATPWTTAYQAPLSMGFSRQEYPSGVPLPSPPLTSTSLIFPLSLILNVIPVGHLLPTETCSLLTLHSSLLMRIAHLNLLCIKLSVACCLCSLLSFVYFLQGKDCINFSWSLFTMCNTVLAQWSLTLNIC